MATKAMLEKIVFELAAVVVQLALVRLLMWLRDRPRTAPEVVIGI